MLALFNVFRKSIKGNLGHHRKKPWSFSLKWLSGKSQGALEKEHNHSLHDKNLNHCDFGKLHCFQAFTDSKWLQIASLRPSDDQVKVLQLVKRRKCVFLTGQAGTGKTHILCHIYRHLTDVYNQKVLVCASTGKAATNINGHTFQYFVGVHGNRRSGLLKFIDCIILDEVSMIPHTVLENFDAAARNIRTSLEPFGGIRMILCGDFLQLPPVTMCKNSLALFECKLFKNNFHPITLTTVHRVGIEHSEFRNGLEMLRRGVLTPEMYEILRSRTGAKADLSNATFLFPRRQDAARRNILELMKLPAPSMSFYPHLTDMKLCPGWTSPVVFRLSKGFVLSARISKIKSAVEYLITRGGNLNTYHFLILNQIEERSGEIVCFVNACIGLSKENRQYEKKKLNELHDSLMQAVKYMGGTVRKDRHSDVMKFISKSMTSTEESERFEETLQLRIGARVMLTRNLTATLVNGSLGVVETFVPANSSEGRDKIPHSTYQHIREYVKTRQKSGEGVPMLPVVRFHSNQRALIPPVECTNERKHLSAGFYFEILSIPLVLAFALTVHKVQGLTLSNQVVVDFKHSFHAPHLAYVALSRVRSPTQLVLRGFSPDLIKVCPKALRFENLLLRKDGPNTMKN